MPSFAKISHLKPEICPLKTDVRTMVSKFTPVFYRTSALWGRCPALTPLLQPITPSRASGTTDHVRSLDDFFIFSSGRLVGLVGLDGLIFRKPNFFSWSLLVKCVFPQKIMGVAQRVHEIWAFLLIVQTVFFSFKVRKILTSAKKKITTMIVRWAY